MSSSGKGQSLVKSADELEHAWEYGCSGSRGDIRELIIEEFIKFDSEITLLTVKMCIRDRSIINKKTGVILTEIMPVFLLKTCQQICC